MLSHRPADILASHLRILHEIEAGRRVWTVKGFTPDFCDQFELDVFVPMLRLASDGRLKIVEERRKPIPSRYRVTYIRIEIPGERAR